MLCSYLQSVSLSLSDLVSRARSSISGAPSAEERAALAQDETPSRPLKQIAEPATARDSLRRQMNRWDDQLHRYPLLHTLEEATGVKKVYLAAFAVLSMFAVLILGLGANALCELVGFCYPVYASFKTIEEPEPEVVRQWLTYWVVYAWFFTVESISDRILSWVPFYFLLKLLFLLWCQLPAYRGAAVVYRSVVRPLVRPYSLHIDTSANVVSAAASVTAHRVSSRLRSHSAAFGRKLSFQADRLKESIKSLSPSSPTIPEANDEEKKTQ
eukprot:TRINITY_DN67549_c6_g1_i2.p1 TRINITY_DN67549_c6_g1~~TRINITY_DN67549_c6_g1_i2.p1  ORF type:complete len:270 (+),score=90.60 TRINITY_DN67549_c6_g1_i2:357-1166(+)